MIFYRIHWASWRTWTRVSTNARTTGVYGHGAYTSSANKDLTDANNALNNEIYTIASGNIISNMPSGTDGQGTLLTLAIDGSSTAGKLQIYSTIKGKIYTRFYWTSWSEWHTSYEPKENYHSVPEFANNLYACFHTVGCIGDSLASGECYSNETGTPIPHDLYEYSWGQCMARRSRCTYYNFSRGGMTAGSWLSDIEHGYALASDGNHVCDAYIIGLGVNDSNYYKDRIGTIADIHLNDPSLNPDTFYGNYGKIISLMLGINPRAKFFCLTAYMNISAINNAIRTIVNYFNSNIDSTMCHLIDLNANYQSEYSNDFIIGNTRYGHYNALAYNYMANIIIKEINYVMYTNYDAFKQIEFSKTDYYWSE